MADDRLHESSSSYYKLWLTADAKDENEDVGGGGGERADAHFLFHFLWSPTTFDALLSAQVCSS